MIKNQHIICLSSADWDNPYWTNQQHIMNRLAAGSNKILYIESLGLRQPVVQKKDFSRLIKRFRDWLKGARKINDNLYVYSPILIPFYRWEIIKKLNHFILLKNLKKLIKKLNLENPILWTYVPNAADFIGKLKENLVVYHCVDEISANPLIPAAIILEMEKILIDKADLVLVSSSSLYETKSKLTKNIYYLPNVADTKHFLKADLPQTKIPEDMANINKPVIGFVGAISSYKLDFELITYTAKMHPEWSIVLIGALGEGEKELNLTFLKEHTNIHILGGRSYPSLPSYLKAFSVCILPNRINQYTENMFPMKFFEYLTTGRPVVTTSLKSLKEFKDLVKISTDKEEFIKNIEYVLKYDTPEEKQKRIKVAEKYNWDNRIEEISRLVEEKLKESIIVLRD